jgi:DNA damage-binding protein 1
LLINLQERLASHVVSVGGIGFMDYRAFRNDVRQEEEPRRFVDGELVEKFLDCNAAVQQKCVDGLTLGDGRVVTVDDVKEIVDNLRRMH